MPRVVAAVTGIVTSLCALFGLFYNTQTFAVSLSGGFADLTREHQMRYFYAAFYTMSAICVSCYVILLWCGFQIARRRYAWSNLLIGVWIFEVIYFLAIGAMWAHSDIDIGASVGGATGVANGG